MGSHGSAPAANAHRSPTSFSVAEALDRRRLTLFQECQAGHSWRCKGAVPIMEKDMAASVETYSDDAPETDPDADKLGVASFAERLAAILVALEAPRGYVIGFSGEWGSGKTTALNYVRTYIERLAPERLGEIPSIITIEFRPWLVSGHQDLVAAFFKVLAEQLGHAPPRWKAALSKAAGVGADLSGALTKIGYLTAHADAGSLMGASIATNRGLKKLSETWGKEPSLQKTYEDLSAILKHAPQKILVVIDDIDRLRPDEIQAMMSMVKTVGQLPNVVYLLSYDRNVVWPALQEKTPAAARTNFAEKLVQQEIALPNPGFDRLARMLLDQAAFLGIDKASDRWSELVEVAMRRWLRTPRDVIRLANNMRFAWPVLSDTMDPLEYLAIEGIRTFDKGLFDWLRDNPFYLFDSRRHSHVYEGSYREAQAFKASMTPYEKVHIVDLTCYLFPRLRNYFDYASEEEAKKDNKKSIYVPVNANAIDRRGIGHAPVYDAYFGFYAPSGVVGRAALSDFLANVEDIERTHRALKSSVTPGDALGRRPTSPLIEAISARLDVDRQTASVPLLRAALRLFSDFADGQTGREAERRRDLAWPLLRALAEHVETAQVLAALSEPDDHVSLYAMTLIAYDVRSSGMTLPLTQDDRFSLVASVRSRIQRAADEGSLRELPSLHAALIVWPDDANRPTVSRDWLAVHLDAPWLMPRLRLFFLSFASRTDNQSAFVLDLSIGSFFDIEELNKSITKYLDLGGEDQDGVFAKVLSAIEDLKARIILRAATQIAM